MNDNMTTEAAKEQAAADLQQERYDEFVAKVKRRMSSIAAISEELEREKKLLKEMEFTG